MIVYMITSPSGKKYIGITSQTLAKRMDGHIRRADSARNNPLSRAICKYGPENFKMDVVEAGLTVEQAMLREVELIQFFGTTDRQRGYNLSPGGKYDGPTGGKVFWGELNKDPKAREIYLKKLSEIKKANDWTDYSSLAKAGKKWREDNPEVFTAMTQRALAAALACQ